MGKYIDADRLQAEIEKRLKNTRDYMNGAGMKYKGPKHFKAQGKESAYDALLNIIDSLQQEQPDFPTTDEQVKEFLATHPKTEVPEKYKSPDWLFKNQEQPEVDLEKKINRFWDSCIKHKNERGSNVIWSNKLEVEVLARYFYELGKNRP